MADENKNFSFTDEQIKNIQQKIAEQDSTDKKKERDIFLRINGQEAQPINNQVNTLTNSELPGTFPDQSNNNKNPQPILIKSLRTFQGDLADAIKNQNASIVTVAIAEKKKQEKEEVAPKITSQEKNHTGAVIISSIVLVLLGVAAIGTFVYLEYQAPPVTQGEEKRDIIVPYNEKTTINIDGSNKDSLVATLFSKSQEASIKENEIFYIELTTQSLDGRESVITTKKFFDLLKTKAPPALIRSFGSKFMFGAYAKNSNISFLLIELDSFDNAFKGMLEWEETIYKDIGSLFARGALKVTETSGENSTTTRILNTDEPQKTFEDITLRNKDARILKNIRGETILMYSFLDNKTLLITGNDEVLKEMINKLASKKLIR